jgi:hypothetical protein
LFFIVHPSRIIIQESEKKRDGLPVEGRKGIFPKAPELFPAIISRKSIHRFVCGNQKDTGFDAPVTVSVAKRSHEDRRNTRIIGNNVTEKVAFLPGEFPEPSEKSFFRTFPYQNSPLVVKKNYGSINFLSKTLFSNRSELLGIMLESQTEIPYRTEATAGSTRCAYQGAQIHNCLIKETSFSLLYG